MLKYIRGKMIDKKYDIFTRESPDARQTIALVLMVLVNAIKFYRFTSEFSGEDLIGCASLKTPRRLGEPPVKIWVEMISNFSSVRTALILVC